jgi:predicted dehydrogenase
MVANDSSKVRFAMIGCGRMGLHHSEKMIADGRGEVVALFDAEPRFAKTLRDELWPSAKVCTTFEELLATPEIQAAVICTPTAEHYLQSKSCLAQGWHVLCEKPLAINRDQIKELIALAESVRSKGQVFSLGYQRRAWSIFRTLRREVMSGRWGKVTAISSHTVEYWQCTIAGTWRDDPAQNAGGFVKDAGSHKFDAIFYITGLKPLEVYARSQKCGSNVEIITSVSALLTDNVTLTMDFIGNAQYLSEDLHIHCERADLMLKHDELWIAVDRHLKRLPADEPDSDPVAGILDVILKGDADRSPPEAALPVYDITQAILTSSQTGLPVVVSK